MRDIRVDRWAQILVEYSLEAKQGQHAILSGGIEAMPLLEACYEKMLEKGVFVEVLLNSETWPEIFYEKSSAEQRLYTPPVRKYAAEICDIHLYVGAEVNSKLLASVDPKKMQETSQGRKPIGDIVLQRAAQHKMRWCYTHFPTAAAAQEANMGVREYEEFIFSLCGVQDAHGLEMWKKLHAKQEQILAFLQGKKELHFQNRQGTDLRVNVEGMIWENCSGKQNFPDGEVFTGPNLQAADGGVNGVARVAFPTLYHQVEVEGIELRFEKGRVVEAKATKGENFLHQMIAQDEGAQYVGEIAIGTNYCMDRITKNILFDEKFGGAFHLALGKGYPETGNTNESGLHWDMIFDLRDGGTIHADGELFHENGQFVGIPELSHAS